MFIFTLYWTWYFYILLEISTGVKNIYVSDIIELDIFTFCCEFRLEVIYLRFWDYWILTKIICIFDIRDSRADIPLFRYIFWCCICLNDLFPELCNSWIHFPIFSDAYDSNLNEIAGITIRSVTFVSHYFIGFTYFNYCSIGFTSVSHCSIGCMYVSYSSIGVTYVTLQRLSVHLCAPTRVIPGDLIFSYNWGEPNIIQSPVFSTLSFVYWSIWDTHKTSL